MKTQKIESFYQSTPQDLVDFTRAWQARNCNFYASDLFECKTVPDFLEVQQAINRTIKLLNTTQYTIEEHFIPVYREMNNKIVRDWKLSKMASFYAIVSGNPENTKIAEFIAYLYDIFDEQ